LYPTRSNDQPNSRNGSATDPNSANYYYDDGVANGYNGGYAVNNSTTSPYDGRTAVGAFSQSSSFFGTFDQDGNVFEWNDFESGGGRGLFGGAWTATAEAMQAASYYNVADPTSEFVNVGFRIAAIPEPDSLGLGCGLILTGAGFLRRTR
jgi:hypothetical protein